ncbi:MAG TPA: isocitrate lyase/phosphoenolpyruvate mutase family protein [Rhizomicrobium sp.]|nr:isocitrate lyase/phosphoenolpyruvate mutase family protein [Rhizomicrobium sp.]
MASQKDRVAQFRDAHAKGKILVLPNAWDAASARLVQDAGAKAVATSSAAVAWSNGYADGEGMSREVAIAATREVLRVVTVPVTVDSEAGYSSDPAKVADHCLQLIDIGVAGINIEDSTEPPDLLVAKIKAIKSAAKARGADIFINARADVYLKNLVPDDKKLGEMVHRAKLYTQAGADGIFAAFMTDPAQIREVVAATELPVNILATKAAPDVSALKTLGVRRLTIGALTGRAAYGYALRAVKMLLDDGKYDAIFATAGDCPDFNKAFG